MDGMVLEEAQFASSVSRTGACSLTCYTVGSAQGIHRPRNLYNGPAHTDYQSHVAQALHLSHRLGTQSGYPAQACFAHSETTHLLACFS